jgi:4-oxalocrotonate tautomerase
LWIAVLTAAGRTVPGSSEASVSVSIEDVTPAGWPERVCCPDILDKPDSLYRKPGYNPFGAAKG